MRQIVRGHALQHRCGGLMVRDARRNADQPVGGHRLIFRIRACNSSVGDAFPDLKILDVAAYRADHPAGLLAQDEWGSNRVAALAEVDVDVVDSRRGDLHDHLVGLWAPESECPLGSGLPLLPFSGLELPSSRFPLETRSLHSATNLEAASYSIRPVEKLWIVLFF